MDASIVFQFIASPLKNWSRYGTASFDTTDPTGEATYSQSALLEFVRVY
jgi:hypothetical protein